jgi:DNA-directed RNA polymerase specialized sigma24 family protein
VSSDKQDEYVATAVAAESPVEVAAAPSGTRLTPGVSDAQLRGLLGRRETQEYIRHVVVGRVSEDFPRADIDDIVNDANVAALRSTSRPWSMETARGWLGTVTARAVAMHFRRGAVHAKYLELEADVEELAAPPDDDLAPRMSVSRWLAHAVADNPRDQETVEILRYKADTGKSHAEVAADHAMTTSALKNRVSKLKARYEPEWRKRERTILLLVLFGIGVVVALALWLLLRPRLPVLGPDVYPPEPKPTATVPPAPFEPAQPTAPRNDKPPLKP